MTNPGRGAAESGGSPPPDLLDRYLAGEHEVVWRILSAATPLSDAWREAADEVAVATMTIVRRNAERLVDVLRAADWPHLYLSTPASDIDFWIDELEQATGIAVPPSIAAYWRIVGSLRTSSYPEDLPASIPEDVAGLDPIDVTDLSELSFELEEWQNQGGLSMAGRFELHFAPDHNHKNNCSGGSYWMAFPNPGADLHVEGEPYDLPFVEYLRLCFSRKGFAMYDEASPHEGGSEAIRWVSDLRFDPEPF